jgi:hypothetical protein
LNKGYSELMAAVPLMQTCSMWGFYFNLGSKTEYSDVGSIARGFPNGLAELEVMASDRKENSFCFGIIDFNFPLLEIDSQNPQRFLKVIADEILEFLRRKKWPCHLRIELFHSL